MERIHPFLVVRKCEYHKTQFIPLQEHKLKVLLNLLICATGECGTMRSFIHHYGVEISGITLGNSHYGINLTFTYLQFSTILLLGSTSKRKSYATGTLYKNASNGPNPITTKTGKQPKCPWAGEWIHSCSYNHSTEHCMALRMSTI